MKYDVEDGSEYGIIDYNNGWFKKLLFSLPLIRRLYSREVYVHVVSRTAIGEPLCSMTNTLRVFKWEKSVPFRFKVGRCIFTNVMMHLTEGHYDRSISACKNFCQFDYTTGKSTTDCEPNREYIESLLICK